MTTRTAEVQTERVVTEREELTVCDGCGREVDPDASEVDTWNRESDGEARHTCPTCEFDGLASSQSLITQVKNSLSSLRPSLPTMPKHPVGAVGGILMTAVPLSLHYSVDATPYSALMLWLLGFAWVIAAGLGNIGAAEATDSYRGEGVLLPLAGLVLAFSLSGSFGLTAAIFVASLGLSVAYVMTVYGLPDG